jgi:hypothetical protein
MTIRNTLKSYKRFEGVSWYHYNAIALFYSDLLAIESFAYAQSSVTCSYAI